MVETKLPANMQEFHQITTLVFAELYIEFPMRKDLSADEIATKLGLSDAEGTLPSGRKFNEVFHHTVAWLREEGYVQGQSQPMGAFGSTTGLTTVHFGPIRGITLTSKALTVMNVVPASLGGATSIEPLGPQILTAATDTSSAHGNTVIQNLMATFFGTTGKST